MRIPKGFESGHDFASEGRIENLKSFYSFCSKSLVEANQLLLSMNDALRKHLVGDSLSKFEHDLLFSQADCNALKESTTGSVGDTTVFFDQENLLHGGFESSMFLSTDFNLIQALRVQIQEQHSIIADQAKEISSLHGRLENVVSRVLIQDVH